MSPYLRKASPTSSSYPSPSFGKLWREGRCFIAKPNFITNISASPPFLLSKREEAVLQSKSKLYNYHICFGSLLITFEKSEYYQSIRKAGAVPCSSPFSPDINRGGKRLGEAVRERGCISKLLYF